MRLKLIVALLILAGNNLWPVLANTSGSRPVITAQNVNDLVSITQLEQGSLRDPVWEPSGKYVFVTGSLGIWRFDVENLNTQPPRLLEQYRAPLAISRDGAVAASLNQNHKIVLWDVQTGQLIRVIYDTSQSLMWIGDLTFSPDGQQLLMGFGRGSNMFPTGGVMIWDVSTGQEIKFLTGEISDVSTLTFSADGEQLATGGYWNLVVWNPATWSIRPMPYASGIYDISFSSDGRWLAYNRSRSSTVSVVDMIQSPEVSTILPMDDLGGYLPPMPDVAFSPVDSTLLATTGDYLQLWDVAAQKKRAQVVSSVHFIVFSPDGSRLAGVDGASLYLYDVASLTEIDRIEIGTTRIGAMLFSDDSHLFAYDRAGYEWYSGNSVRVWETSTLSEFALITYHTQLDEFQTPFLQNHISQWSGQPESGPKVVRTSVNLMAIPNACHTRDDIKALIAATSPANTPIHTFQGHEFSLGKLCLSPDGQMVVTTDWEAPLQTYSPDAQRSIRVWNVLTGQQVALLEYTPLSMGIYMLAFSPDGRFFAVVEDTSIRVWDTSTWHAVATVEADGYRQLLFTISGDVFVTRTHWGEISFWNTQTGERLRVIEHRLVSDMLLSPDGSLLALARENDTLESWGVPQNVLSN
jgi:WD40 repeat protein